jgi:heme A synthase
MLAQPPKGRLFIPLAFTTVFFTIGLIVFGAIVRVTDSGLGCGNAWPSCNGTFFPPLDNVTAWIEWLHRLIAAAIGALGLGMLAIAITAYRRERREVLIATAVAAGLFMVQSALGALVVVLDLPPTLVTLHLGTAMLLLAALLLAGLFATYRPRTRYARDNFTALGVMTALLSLVIILTGALVRGSGATLACTTWPLCNGQVVPLSYGGGISLEQIHMLHRFAVLVLGVALGLLVWQAFRARHDTTVRYLAVGAFALYLMQAGVGALYVLTSAGREWGAAHVGMAAATWALLVALSAVDYLNTQRAESQVQREEEQRWPVPLTQ